MSKQNIILAIVGVIVLIGILFFGLQSPETNQDEVKVENAEQEQVVEETSPDTGSSNEVATQGAQDAPQPPADQPQTTPHTQSDDQTTQDPEPETAQPPADPDPQPVPYSPGFLTSSRVTPEIPSEDERATLPECGNRTFTFSPVDINFITSIDPNGSLDANAPASFTWMDVSTNSKSQEYDLVIPGDVYVTHIVQETNISEDPEDYTVYFALCRDVIGYVTHIKKISIPMFNILSGSSCYGQPHAGENACPVEALELFNGGGFMGNVGRIEGRFGFGVIDLRNERGLANASQYDIKTNFAACPFNYLPNPDSYFAKLSSSNELCSTQ